jgi:hypothetical protein
MYAFVYNCRCGVCQPQHHPPRRRDFGPSPCGQQDSPAELNLLQLPRFYLPVVQSPMGGEGSTHKLMAGLLHSHHSHVCEISFSRMDSRGCEPGTVNSSVSNRTHRLFHRKLTCVSRFPQNAQPPCSELMCGHGTMVHILGSQLSSMDNECPIAVATSRELSTFGEILGHVFIASGEILRQLALSICVVSYRNAIFFKSLKPRLKTYRSSTSLLGTQRST